MWERSAANLRFGVRLLIFHGAIQSCEDCKKFWYYGPNKVTKRGGQMGLPVIIQPRPKGVDPPCLTCPKIPKGRSPVPESAEELTEQNFRAYIHYQECRAVGDFPSDPIVRRNARIIRAVEDDWQQAPWNKILSILETVCDVTYAPRD